jgi:HlyD family secretion protein
MPENRENIEDITEQLRQIEIRSEEVQEIMGFIPHWIIRWGITVIFIIIFLSLVGSWFFKYPDVIFSNVVLTTEHPPAPLVARVSGKIEELFVRDNQTVEEGAFIAIIENATNNNHLLQLKKQLEKLKDFFTYFETRPTVEFEKKYSLGELQSTYAQFLTAYADYRHFITLDYHRKKIDSTKVQIDQYNRMYEQSKRQLKIIEEELKLSRQEYERSTELFKDKIISRRDYEAARTGHLQKKYAYEGAQTSLANSGIRISQLEQSVLDLELQYRADKKRLELALSQAYENLTGRIAQWEQSYLLKAPIKGVVTFNKFWSINQNVKAGDRVVTIIPEEGGKIIGKVVLPIQGSGKVKVGQIVNIKFTNYPYMEYGMVKGVVKSKSLVAADNFYSLEVHLPDGMITSYGNTLEFTQEMQGTAEIITEDIRLITRILKPLKAIMDKM